MDRSVISATLGACKIEDGTRVHRNYSYVMDRSSGSTLIPASAQAPGVPAAWSAQDEHFATMFWAWKDLPISDSMDEMTLLNTLKNLENLIPPFEEAIQHSDSGFDAWRERHKNAMEARLTVIPDWPALQQKDRPIWQNEKWNERYTYIAHQRVKIVQKRLGRLGLGCSAARTAEFFGGGCEHPSRATYHSQSIVARRKKWLPKLWWESVQFLLVRRAQRTGEDPYRLVAEFWQPLVGALPADMSVVKREPAEMRLVKNERKENKTPGEVKYHVGIEIIEIVDSGDETF